MDAITKLVPRIPELTGGAEAVGRAVDDGVREGVMP